MYLLPFRACVVCPPADFFQCWTANQRQGGEIPSLATICSSLHVHESRFSLFPLFLGIFSTLDSFFNLNLDRNGKFTPTFP